MRSSDELTQLASLPQDRDHDRVEKKKRERTFGEESEPEKNSSATPRQPAFPRLIPPTQPADKSERGERNVERFDLDQATFFEQAKIGQPHHGGGERSVRPKGATRDRQKGTGDYQDRQDRRKTRRPFIARVEKFKRAGDEPVDQRRFAQIRLAPNLGHDVVAGLQHRDCGQDSTAFFAFQLERAQSRQVNQRPN